MTFLSIPEVVIWNSARGKLEGYRFKFVLEWRQNMVKAHFARGSH